MAEVAEVREVHAVRRARPRAEWTGRLEFDLVDEHGWRFGRIELVVREHFVSVWWDSRTLGILDRERFRRWLAEPDHPEHTHDAVTFHRAPDALGLQVQRGPVHPIPGDVTARLLTLV